MGCDGGVLAMQRKFMRNIGHKMNDKPPEEISKRERALIRSRCCALSNELLNDPVVACELGNLYNKDTIIMALIERTLNPAFQHVRGLKDLIDCKFTLNPKYIEASASPTEVTDSSGEVIAKYICPVTRLEWTPRQSFVIIRTTGWVLCERAIKEVGIENLQDEYGPFTMEDVIKLVPDEEEEGVMRQSMMARRAAAKSKKDKKRKREGDKASTEETGASSSSSTTNRHDGATKPSSSSAAASSSKGPAFSDKVMSVVEQAKKAAKEQTTNSQVYKSLFGDDKSSDKKGKPDANKLFISTAAPRYTIS